LVDHGRVGVTQPDIDPGATQRQPQRGPHEPGSDDEHTTGQRRCPRTGGRSVPLRHLVLLGDVVAQDAGAVQVDVADLAARARGLHMGHQPHHPRHGAGDIDLLRAHHRDVGDPQGAYRSRRKRRAQVGRRGEQDADDVVRLELVALEHGAHQLRGALQQMPGFVHFELRGSTYGTNSHNSAPYPLGPRGRRDGGPVGYSPTASYNLATSSARSTRVLSGRRSPRATGPNRVRTNRRTGWPTASRSRRTTCLRPSCSTTSTMTLVPTRSTTRNECTVTGPSSSSTPA